RPGNVPGDAEQPDGPVRAGGDVLRAAHGPAAVPGGQLARAGVVAATPQSGPVAAGRRGAADPGPRAGANAARALADLPRVDHAAGAGLTPDLLFHLLAGLTRPAVFSRPASSPRGRNFSELPFPTPRICNAGPL